MKGTSVLLVVAILAFATYGLSLAAQEQQSPASPTAAQSQPAPKGSMNKASSEKSFTGTIMKSGDAYVLQDSVSGASYHLDDQEAAKKFENKQVKVTGTLDVSSNVIHVSNIEAGAS